jgi:hypothetical protein
MPRQRKETFDGVTYSVFEITESNSNNKKFSVYTQQYKGQRPKKRHFGAKREVNKNRDQFLKYVKRILPIRNSAGEVVVNDLHSQVYWNLRHCYKNTWGTRKVEIDGTTYKFINYRYDIQEANEKGDSEGTPVEEENSSTQEESDVKHHEDKKKKRRNRRNSRRGNKRKNERRN